MSEILDIANEMANELFEAGLMDDITFREMQALCLPRKKPFKPEDIKRIRTACHVSQAVFAALLGIGKSTVQQWEQGVKKPSGPALRLLDIVDRKGLAALR
ncbi:DNA-binding transcriptional regulator [Geomonas oryzisoli]|uniref:DNA-binding transcriptional regulator n=1 Tax=Geomonas oryzisoli TaxID=2847992 RepID=A0ABX8J621_9BACT|nr:DNA-binding transcriptional regulator [Geomonas oryzisoli]QWV93753.1 DNA-binding transcriptional regulator [Geomonas oryzisoli]